MTAWMAAAVNFRPRFGKIADNLERIEAWVAELDGRGATLICFPELAVTGYDRTEAIRDLAQLVPGPAADRLASMAQRWRVDVLAGLPGVDAAANLDITQVVAGADGSVAVYRKLHLNAPEQAVFRAGDDLGVFRRPGLICGVQLCYDAHFPELSALQALAGADLLYCNLVGEGPRGQRFGGVALALAPKGELLASHVGWDEGYVLATVDTEALRRIRNTVMCPTGGTIFIGVLADRRGARRAP